MAKSILLGAVLLAWAIPATAFEGTVTSRRITVKKEAITKLVGGDPKDAEKIMAVSPEKLVDAKDAGIDTRTSTISISGSKIRVDAAANVFILMDADTGLFQVVNTKENQAMEWTREAMRSASDKLAAMGKLAAKPQGLDAELAKLPPEKRAQVEAMLKKAAEQPTPGPEVKLRDTGKSETILGHKCQGFDAKVGDETTLGWVTQDSEDVAKAFKAFASAEQAIRPGPKNPRLLLADKGLPIRVQNLSPKEYQVDEIIKIEPKKIPDDLFKIPPGVIKTSADSKMGGAKPK